MIQEKINTLYDVEAETKRFLKKLESFLYKLEQFQKLGYKDIPPSKDNAGLRRAAIDLKQELSNITVKK